MVPAARWLIVALLAAALVGTPLVLRSLPAEGSNLGAVALASRISDSAALGWSGEVRSVGSLSVPVGGSTFGGLARLLGEESRLLVWWRGPQSWRVDRIRVTGESDLVHDGGLSVQWDYEGNHARFAPYSAVRLPDDSDALPPSLAALLLSGARPEELSRLPARRVAGRSAAGLRLVPADHRSTVARVDVWADESTGVPLRVDAYAVHGSSRRPVVSTTFEIFHPGRPPRSRTGIELAASLDYSRGVSQDEAGGANLFAPFVPPDQLAGLSRRGDASAYGAVGVYGRGPTALIALPLRRSVSEQLAAQLRRSSSSRAVPSGIAMEVGPLSVLLVEMGDGGHFLLAGTVTPATLRRASADLITGVRTVTR